MDGFAISLAPLLDWMSLFGVNLVYEESACIPALTLALSVVWALLTVVGYSIVFYSLCHTAMKEGHSQKRDKNCSFVVDLSKSGQTTFNMSDFWDRPELSWVAITSSMNNQLISKLDNRTRVSNSTRFNNISFSFDLVINSSNSFNGTGLLVDKDYTTANLGCIWLEDVGHADTWARIIHYLNLSINGLIVYALLVVISRTRWPHLWAAVRRMETVLKFDLKMYRKFRLLSYSCIVYILVITISVSYLMISKDAATPPSKLPDPFGLGWTTHAINRCVLYVSQNVPTCALILYCILCFFLAANHRAVVVEIDQLCQVKRQLLNETIHLQIMKWKRLYVAVSDCSDLINYSFGWMLMLSMSVDFSAIINQFFNVLRATYVSSQSDERDGSFFINVAPRCIFITQFGFQFWLMNYAAEQIKTEARHVQEALLNLHAVSPMHEQQIYSLITHIASRFPKMTAAGLVDVSVEIFPSAVAGVITYVVIFFAFFLGKSGTVPATAIL